jgi:hypothetical protein
MPEEYMESELILPQPEEKEEQKAQEVEDEFDIEVVDDTPEEDRRPPRTETKEPEPQGEEDELKNYSENVQKRIKRLKYEFHEERRQKEKSEREKAEALNYAAVLQQQLEQFRQQNEASQRALVQTSVKQKGSELEAAKRQLKEAYESGDTDKMASAQEAIAVLANEKRVLESYTPPTGASVSYLQPQETPQPQYTPQPAPQPQAPQVSAKAVLWKERNPWFGQDMALTGYAIDIHNKLVNAGVDTESDQYYQAIDSAVNQFKNNIPGTQEKPATPAPKPKNGVVVSSSRTASGQTRTKVQLTESALAVAKRLGITPQQYAKELLKQQKEME